MSDKKQPVDFETEWAKKVNWGYKYGEDELIQVRLGFEMCLQAIQEQQAADPQAGRWIKADDVLELTRTLDVAMNGEEGAASHPALCDVVAQAKPILEHVCGLQGFGEPGDICPACLCPVSANLTKSALENEFERGRQSGIVQVCDTIANLKQYTVKET